MAALLPVGRVGQVRVRQPSGPVALNASNSLTRDMIGAYPTGLQNIAGTKGRLTASATGASIIQTELGTALSTRSNGYFQDQSLSLATPPAFTMACFIRVPVLLGYNQNVLLWTDGTSVASIEQLSVSTSGYVRVDSYRSGSPGPALTAGTVTANRWHFIAMVVFSNAGRTAHLDGESASVGGTANTGGADQWLTIGAAPWAGYTSDSADVDVIFPMVWARGLIDEELRSVRNNPWQLVAPIQRPRLISLPIGPFVYARPTADNVAGLWVPS